jgi:hypothetical protein
MKKILLAAIVLLGLNSSAFSQTEFATLIIISNADDGFVVLDNDYSTCKEFKKGEKVQIDSSAEKLTILTPSFEDVSTKLDLESGEEKTFNINPKYLSNNSQRRKSSTYPRCFWDSNVIVLSDEDATTSLDGKTLNEPSIRLSIETDTEIRVVSTLESISSEKVFKVSSFNDLEVIDNYLRRSESELRKRSFIPGYAQISKQQKAKGYFLVGLATTFTASTIFSQVKIIQSENEFSSLENEYNRSTDPAEILQIIEASNKELDTIDKFKKIRTTSILALLATYTFNVFDGLREPKIGFRNFSFDPYIDFDRSMIPKANVKIDF